MNEEWMKAAVWRVSVEDYGNRSGQATISGPGVYCMQVPVSYSMLDFMQALAAAPAQPAAQDQGEVEAQRLRDWVACVERLPADKRDVMVYCADSDEHMVGSSIGGGLFLFATASHGEKVVCRPTHWRYIDESDKPDLAASTGQEV